MSEIDRVRRRTVGALLSGLVVTSPLARLASALPGPPPGPASAPARPVVARARRPGLLDASGAIDPARLDDALGRAIACAAGEGSPVEAFRRLFRPNDVVGIKVNCIAGRGLSTRPEVAMRIAHYLRQAGIPARNILIWDRTDRELRSAGFTIARNGHGEGDGDGVRVFGTEDRYEVGVRDWGPAGSRFARFLADEATALINVAVLKDHGLAGASLGMKNWYGAVHNPNKLHDDGCQPFIPHLAAVPLLRDRLRMTIVDGTVGQCHGGPGRSPRWFWPYQGYLASTDPVAVDAVGWTVLDARRRDVGLLGLAADGREPKYVAEAAKLGLGVADLERVRVEDV